MKKLILIFFILTATASAQFAMVGAWQSGALSADTAFTNIDSLKGVYVAADLGDSLGRLAGDTIWIMPNRAKYWVSWPYPDFIQPTGANRPVFRADSNVLVFTSAASKHMYFDYETTAQPFTVVMAYKAYKPALAQVRVASKNTVTSWAQIYWNDAGTGERPYAGSFLNTGVTLNGDSTYVVTVVFNGASSIARINTRQYVGTTGAGGFGDGIALGARLPLNNPSDMGFRVLVVYHKVLSAIEIQNVENRVADLAGVTLNPFLGESFVFEGNSLTNGSPGDPDSSYHAQLQDSLGAGDYRFTNIAVNGQTLLNMMSDTATQVDGLYISTASRNRLFVWAGTNDIFLGADSTTAYNRLVQYCSGRKIHGYQVFVFTLTPQKNNATSNANIQGLNRAIRANYATFADVLVDIASDPRIGDPGDELDGTYYWSDQLHLNSVGLSIVASYVYQAILANP